LDVHESVVLAFRMFLGRQPTTEEQRMFAHYLAEHDVEALALALMRAPEFRETRAREIAPFDSSVVMRTVNGCSMLMPTHDWVYDTRQETVTYEPWVARVIDSRLQPGSVFVDIGANVGVHSVYASARVGPAGKVVAVEALPANAAILMRTIGVCGYRNIVVCALPLSDTVGIEWLTNHSHGSNQRIDTAPEAAQAAERVAVLAACGDLFMGWLNRLDLVKVDVEGRERSVLKGMRQTLERFRPAVIAEFHPHLEESDFVNVLFDLGYGARLLHVDNTTSEVIHSHAELADKTRARNALTGMTHADLLFEG
jgi:FkbM family methyltransferase